MHIVQITDDFPPRIGGMAAHAWELSRALVKLGHQVTVLTAVELQTQGRRFMLEKVEEREGIRIVNLGFKFFLRRYFSYYSMLRIRKHLHRLAMGIGRIVLHLHEFPPPRIRMISDLPIVWTNHSSKFLNSFENVSLRKNLEAMIRPFDRITSPSRELFEKTINLGYPAHRTSYIPNGVDVERFNPNGRTAKRGLRIASEDLSFSKDRCVVICARRFAYKNGLHVYLKALESIRSDLLSKCVFLFAGNKTSGNTSYGKEIEKRIRKLSCKTDCRLLGPVSNDYMPDLYRNADISVLPSLIEATSITGLESMASGLPIVGTNVGGIPEIVENGATGLLCQPNDARALAKNLKILIRRASMRQRLGSNARKLAESKFAWPIIAKQFLDVYELAIQSRITKI